MEDKEDDKKQGSCEQRWSHKFVNDTWPVWFGQVALPSGKEPGQGQKTPVF